MSLLVSVDPGLRICGVAVFEDGALQRAMSVRSSALPGDEVDACAAMARAVCEAVCDGQDGVPGVFVVEEPQQYPGSPVPRSAIQALDRVLGALGSDLRHEASADGHGLSTHPYKPRAWKGQVPKPIMLRRILQRLTDDELRTAPHLISSLEAKSSIHHHAIDAVGVALHHLGRLRAARGGGAAGFGVDKGERT